MSVSLETVSMQISNLTGLVRALLDGNGAGAAAACSRLCDPDEVLETPAAMALMGYVSAHRFMKAARGAGVYPISRVRPFRFKKVDLMRWQAAPKMAKPRVRVTCAKRGERSQETGVRSQEKAHWRDTRAARGTRS